MAGVHGFTRVTVGDTDTDPGADGNLLVTGVIKAGSTPTTITNSAGKVLESAIADGTVYPRLASAETWTGVQTFSAASARPIIVSRSGADAGIQLSSVGGSGTAFGIVADTDGNLTIQHDADADPKIVLSSSAITIGATGGVGFSGGQILIPNGSESAPSFSFSNDTDTGIFRDTQNTLEIASGGVSVFQAHLLSGGAPQITIPSADYGSGVAGGPQLTIGRNTNASAAPGVLRFIDRSGFGWSLWVDTSGKLRIHQTAPQNGASDTSGTIVGTQS